MSINLETICPHGLNGDHQDQDDGNDTSDNKPDNKSNNLNNDEGKKEAATTSKMLLGHFTIVYVIKGSIKASVEGDERQWILKEGETMICEVLLYHD